MQQPTEVAFQPRAETGYLNQVWQRIEPLELAIFGLTVVVFGLVLWVASKVLERGAQGQSFARQVTMLLLTFSGILACVFALPISMELKTALLGLIGIVLSAVLALSSTTLMGNALAGLMLRSLKNFKVGDFIRCGEEFGRVTERGLIHTEIQTEDSDLVTLPNLFLVTHPLTTVRATSTIASATVSLGYDVARGLIEEKLVAAATKAGLEAPFVQILDLGDYSVTYRVAGLLKEVKQLLSCRSSLRGLMMDELHGAGIEIVSPTFMNQRPISKEFVPEESEPTRRRSRFEAAPEALVFDKAEAAQTLEVLREERVQLELEIAELEKRKKGKSDEERARIEQRVTTKQERRESLGHVIEAYEEKQRVEDG